MVPGKAAIQSTGTNLDDYLVYQDLLVWPHRDVRPNTTAMLDRVWAKGYHSAVTRLYRVRTCQHQTVDRRPVNDAR
jgi:hypothetical protein